jgi:hypothetical protein
MVKATTQVTQQEVHFGIGGILLAEKFVGFQEAFFQ